MVRKVKISGLPLKKAQRLMRKRWLKRRGATGLVNNSLQPIAQRYICSMKYSQTISLSSLSPIQRFNLNSIFDPDRTGGGHQPYGHDTFQTLYNRYRVISCSYVLTVYNGTVPVRIAALPANEDITAGTVSEFTENPRARFMVQYPGGNTNILKGKVHIPSLVGRTKAQYMADDRYQATFGSSPSELAVLNILAANLADTPADNTFCTIELKYKVEMFDVKNLAQS